MKQKYMMTWAALLLLIVLPCNLAMAAPAIARPGEQQEHVIIHNLKVYMEKTKQQVLDFGKRILGQEQYSQEEVQLARAKLTFAFAITALLAAGVWRFKPREKTNTDHLAQEPPNPTKDEQVTDNKNKQKLSIDDQIKAYISKFPDWANEILKNDLQDAIDNAKKETLSRWNNNTENMENISNRVNNIQERLKKLEKCGSITSDLDKFKNEFENKSLDESEAYITSLEERAKQGWINRLLSPLYPNTTQ